MVENKKLRIFKGYKFTIETIIILQKLSEKENRAFTNTIENLILTKGKEENIFCTDKDVEEFIEKNIKQKKSKK